MTSPCLNTQSLEHRPSWPKQQKQQLTLALSSVHQRQSIWLWIATLSQPFKSMEIQSTMYQILDTLVPWWHLAQVTSKGESHLLGVHSGSWNNFGRVHTYPLQQKLTCVTILLYGCESWVISQDMENKINAFATSCYRVMLNIKRWTPPSIPWLTLCLWFIWLGTASWNFLVTSSECQRKSLLEDMLCTFQPLAKGDLVDHVLHTLIMYKDCLGIMKEQCKNSRLPHLLMIVVHGETLWSPAPQPMDDDEGGRHFYCSFIFKNGFLCLTMVFPNNLVWVLSNFWRNG